MLKLKLALGKFLKRKGEIKDQKAGGGIKDDKARTGPKFSLLNLFRKKRKKEEKA